MGVLKADHHQGIGSQLIQEAIRWCQRESMAFYRLRHWQRRIQTNIISVHETFIDLWDSCRWKLFPPFGERKIHAC